MVVGELLLFCVSVLCVDLDVLIDFKCFMGIWYVIGCVLNFIECGYVVSVNEYELCDEYKVGIIYCYCDGFGEFLQEICVCVSVDLDSGNYGWCIWFYCVVLIYFWVLDVVLDYLWVLIGYLGCEMVWIFLCMLDMDKILYKELVECLCDEYGVNIDKFKCVLQYLEQVGKLGYEVLNVC